MKRTTLIFILTIILVVTSMPVFAETENDMEDAIRAEVTSELENSEEFKMMVEEYGQEEGQEMIDKIVEGKIRNLMDTSVNNVSEVDDISTMRAQPAHDWIVPNIKQRYNYYCGPAAVLQSLYGMGLEGDVSGSTNNSKQSTLASEMGTSTNGTDVYRVRNALNDYTGTSDYVYFKGSSTSLTLFRYDLAYSLDAGYPVILHARTGQLAYYNGHNTGHYISLDIVYGDYNDTDVNLADPNRNDDYFGDFSVPLSEAKAAVSQTDRYYIYGVN